MIGVVHTEQIIRGYIREGEPDKIIAQFEVEFELPFAPVKDMRVTLKDGYQVVIGNNPNYNISTGKYYTHRNIDIDEMDRDCDHYFGDHFFVDKCIEAGMKSIYLYGEYV